MSSNSRLDHAFQDALHLPLDCCSRYVLFSDCHRGCGSTNDNFLKNQHIYIAALQYYLEYNFTYLELGDGDELWENRSMKNIVDTHSNVFRILTHFHKQNRLFLLYGNHDIVKKDFDFHNRYLQSYYCRDSQCNRPLLPGFHFYEGIILDNHDIPDNSIYLTHGHQASCLNSTFWRLARFLVRYFWLPLEQLGINDPTSAAKNYSTKEKTEKRLSTWAQKNRRILITGHTHRPVLHQNEITYFNTGSCIHPLTVTCIELDSKNLTLVKWYMSTRFESSVYIAREVIAGPYYIDEYFTNKNFSHGIY